MLADPRVLVFLFFRAVLERVEVFDVPDLDVRRLLDKAHIRLLVLFSNRGKLASQYLWPP